MHMKYYQELTLLPSYDVPVNFIWSNVYQQLHLGFASQQREGIMNIGVSFPGYTIGDDNRILLGNKLRIFAENENELSQLAVSDWLKRLDDYVHLTRIRRVPNAMGYAIYSRWHKDGSPEQKARRFAKRHGISYEDAARLFSMKRQKNLYPYIQLKSLTNHHSFDLFIKKEKSGQPVQGSFGSYGLSNVSTVPEF